MLCKVTVLMLVVGAALAYKDGPPVGDNPEICGTMMPVHSGSTVQTDTVFQILSDTCFNEDTTLNVHVKIIEEDSTFFEGFFLQARKVTAGVLDPTSSVGVFSSDDGEVKTLACFGGTAKNAVGHSTAKHYVDKVVQWTSSADLNVADTKIQFFATVVRHDTEIWLGVHSDDVSYTAECNTTVSADPIFTSGAGVSGVTLFTVLSALLMAFVY